MGTSEAENRVTGAEKKPSFNWIHLLAMVVIVVLVIGLDQLTKWLIETNVNPGEVWFGWDFVNIRFIKNPGISWGLFSGFSDIITWLIPGIVILIVIFYFYFIKSSGPSLGTSIGFGLIIGGAAGNSIDRIRHTITLQEGFVTDFINFSFWPTFNVADSAVSIGLVVIVLALLLESTRKPKKQPEIDSPIGK